jgi:hypothetical protein
MAGLLNMLSYHAADGAEPDKADPSHFSSNIRDSYFSSTGRFTGSKAGWVFLLIQEFAHAVFSCPFRIGRAQRYAFRAAYSAVRIYRH